MHGEPGISQRGIVGRKIAFVDAELPTKYTLPFVDATWEVPFTVLDLLGRPPQTLPGPLHSDGLQLRTPLPIRSLRPIESTAISVYATLVHWDPWWAFRGVGGVDRTWTQAIFATNIAHPFRHMGRTFKIHDLRFAEDMTQLEAVIVKDELFRTTEFHSGDIDILGLRGGPRTTPNEGGTQRPAKAL